MEPKEIVKQMLHEELGKMALPAVSSDKNMVKDAIVKSICIAFSRKQYIPKYGHGGIEFTELITKLHETNIYKWIDVVNRAKSKEEMIKEIRAAFNGDQPFVSKLLTKKWAELSNLFGIQWKTNFVVSKDEKQEPLLRRRPYKKREPVVTVPVPAVPEKPWIENVPEDTRHIVQMLSELGTTPFQRSLIKTILSNRFSEQEVAAIAFNIVATNGHKYELSVKKL